MAGFLPPQAQAGEGGNDSGNSDSDNEYGGLSFQHLSPTNLSIDYIILDDLW